MNSRFGTKLGTSLLIVLFVLIVASFYFKLLLSLPFIIFALIACTKGRWRWVVYSLILFSVLSFVPIDIVLSDSNTHFKLVPVVMGLPSEASLAAAARGEIWLGGCVIRRNQPKWVIIL